MNCTMHTIPVPEIAISTSFHKSKESIGDATEPLVLRNKAPRWHEQLQCWCLNFRGRVTVASVKNFQLVSVVESSHNVPVSEQESDFAIWQDRERYIYNGLSISPFGFSGLCNLFKQL